MCIQILIVANVCNNICTSRHENERLLERFSKKIKRYTQTFDKYMKGSTEDHDMCKKVNFTTSISITIIISTYMRRTKLVEFSLNSKYYDFGSRIKSHIAQRKDYRRYLPDPTLIGAPLIYFSIITWGITRNILWVGWIFDMLRYKIKIFNLYQRMHTPTGISQF